MRRMFLVVVFVLSLVGTIFGVGLSNSNPETVNLPGLPQFSREELKDFDGSDPSKPIYLGLDGLVYDVTPGKEFYQVGGPYHSLAGKDSSRQLHLFGGSIIKRKYQVIGTLKP